MSSTDHSDGPSLIDVASRGRARLAAFVRQIAEAEWTWSPEEGIPSARDVVASLLAQEATLRARFADSPAERRQRRGARPEAVETPAAAARALTSERAATVDAFRAAKPARGAEAEDFLLRLVFADGAAFGEIALLARLIDPLRAAPAFV